MPKEKEWSGFAIAGFILSITGGFGLLGIIFSSLGLNETAVGDKKGRGFAIAGLVVGIVSFVFSIFYFMFLMMGVMQGIYYSGDGSIMMYDDEGLMMYNDSYITMYGNDDMMHEDGEFSEINDETLGTGFVIVRSDGSEIQLS